jgi:tyrosine-protein phosphatase SIW14
MREIIRILGVPGLHNCGVVAEGKIYRSAQPELYEALPQYLGIRSVLHFFQLREDSQNGVVESAGMRYVGFRLNVFSNITVEDFDLLVGNLSNPDNQPILVHCLSGSDRTGVVCAAYRMAVDSWTMAEALEEMLEYGAHTFLDPNLIHCLSEYAKAKGYPK